MVLRGDESRIDPEIWADPFPFYRALRAQAPVYYDAKLDTYIVSRYADALEIMRDDETYSLQKAFEGTYASGRQDEFFEIMNREGGGVFRPPKDPPGHTRTRRQWLPLFTAQRMKQLEPMTRRIVGELVDEVARRGHADGIKDIGIPMTSQIMCAQLGLDFEQIGAEKFAAWGRAALAQNGRRQSYDEMLANAKLLVEKQRLLIATVKERMAEPRDDMISWLLGLRLEDDETPTTWEEVVGLVSALMVAGADTTASALGNLLLAMATEPLLVEELRETVVAGDDRLVGRFVEETLRLHPPTHGQWRVPRRDVEVAGVTIPAGSQVCIMFASANDDEAHFACPRTLDVHRDNTLSHLSFGAGIHRCVGAPLARMEIKVAAQEIVTRLDDIRLATSHDELTYVNTFATYTLERLPLTFARRRAGATVQA